jgi:GTPase SAR1 family protein
LDGGAGSSLPHSLPPAGFNVETVEYKNISFTVWDVGGQDKASAAVCCRRRWLQHVSQRSSDEAPLYCDTRTPLAVLTD